MCIRQPGMQREDRHLHGECNSEGEEQPSPGRSSKVGTFGILDEIELQLDIKEGETTEDLEYSLETVACIGACGLSPCIMVNNKVEAKLTPKKVGKLFRKADAK